MSHREKPRAGLLQGQLWRFCLALLLLLPFAAPAAAQDFPKLTGRVVDGANLLSPAQEAALTSKLQSLEQASSRQLVVATVPSLQGYEIEDYGYRLGRAWGIGQGEADNGAILLVAPTERRVRIEVGYGLEAIVTDALSSLIIQNTILPRFREGDYPGGIDAGTDAIIEQLQAPPEAAEKRVAEASAAAAARPSARSKNGGGAFGAMMVMILVFLFVLLPLFGRKRRRRGPWGSRRYGGSNWPIVLWAIADGISHSSGRGGGGWGGGGGGGFGGFSGGGGSFGGGGASGSW